MNETRDHHEQSTKVADRIAEEIPSRNLLAVTYRDLPDPLPLWKIRHNGVGAIVCNPASLTYYGLSFSLTYYGLSPWDALDETETDLAIVHISNLHAREQWRRHDVFAEIASVYLARLGWRGYLVSLDTLHQRHVERIAADGFRP